MPSHLGFFILSNSKTINNFFTRLEKELNSSSSSYQDENATIIEKNRDKLNKARYLWKKLGHKKKHYSDGGMFYALFLATNVKNCLTFTDYGFLSNKKVFKGILDVFRELDRKKHMKMQPGLPVSQEFLLTGKLFSRWGYQTD